MPSQNLCRIILKKENSIDTMQVQIAMTSGAESIDSIRHFEKTKNDISKSLQDTYGISPHVSFVEPLTIMPQNGEKFKFVVDER
jgi:phenylacetate-coenzyme A ligase PaaK-like adenylate-forming protein